MPYDFNQARFSARIDTLTLDLTETPMEKRAPLLATLQEQLGVSVLPSSRFKTRKYSHPMGDAGITIQDITPEVAAKLIQILQACYPSGDLPKLHEIHVALDARLTKPVSHTDDYMALKELFGVLARHLLVDPEITQDTGGMRWTREDGTVIARIGPRSSIKRHWLESRYRHIDPVATMYLGRRGDDLEYMVIHKRTDKRWGDKAASLPSAKRCIRIEARIRGSVLAHHGLTEVTALLDRKKLRALSSLFSFRCPVVSDPDHENDMARYVFSLVAKMKAANFQAGGVWAVVDSEISHRGTTRKGIRVGYGPGSPKRRKRKDGTRGYTAAARAYRVVAHEELGRIVDRAFRRFSLAMSKGAIESV